MLAYQKITNYIAIDCNISNSVFCLPLFIFATSFLHKQNKTIDFSSPFFSYGEYQINWLT
jgi:hypothetical protein